MKKTASTLNARLLRWILAGSIVCSVIVGIAAVWYLNGLLAIEIAKTNDAEQSSQTSDTNLERAQALKVYLQNHNDDVQKAASVIANATTYQYQNQIVKDVTTYAKAAEVTIVGFDFPQDISAATIDTATGLKSLTATIKLSDPVKYTSYLKFLKYIEQNLTKIQITDISLSPLPSDPNYIKDTSVGIQVYVQ